MNKILTSFFEKKITLISVETRTIFFSGLARYEAYQTKSVQTMTSNIFKLQKLPWRPKHGKYSLVTARWIKQPGLLLFTYRVSHNLWQFLGNWLQIANYDRYSHFEVIFEMLCLYTSIKVQKITHSAHERSLKLLFFKATQKNSWRGFFQVLTPFLECPAIFAYKKVPKLNNIGWKKWICSLLLNVLQIWNSKNPRQEFFWVALKNSNLRTLFYAECVIFCTILDVKRQGISKIASKLLYLPLFAIWSQFPGNCHRLWLTRYKRWDIYRQELQSFYNCLFSWL